MWGCRRGAREEFLHVTSDVFRAKLNAAQKRGKQTLSLKQSCQILGISVLLCSPYVILLVSRRAGRNQTVSGASVLGCPVPQGLISPWAWTFQGSGKVCFALWCVCCDSAGSESDPNPVAAAMNCSVPPGFLQKSGLTQPALRDAGHGAGFNL